jgi:hypothetical protein
MFRDIWGIKHFAEEPDPVVELGRICYKGNAAHLYLPKRVCERLRLDREKHSTLIIVAHNANSLFLVKDSEIANILRPKILELRKKYFGDADHYRVP